MSTTDTPRLVAMRAIATRKPIVPDVPSMAENPKPTSAYFGSHTFGAKQMRDKLSKEVYDSLTQSVRLGKKLEPAIAPAVAKAVKEWAIAQGVTHFCHWFQPQTGLTAEKHDAFLTLDANGNAIEKFTAEQLIQSEPDASSFPSGGLRATWEARGYTAWNPASPLFIMEAAGTKTLCIPSVFIGYNGEALDEVAPLFRSSEVLSKAARELLDTIGDKGALRVYTTMGTEQEFFVIDRTHFAMRPDLVMGGRTVVGAPPPRGQQLEDHYFGGIPERVQAFLAEVEHELYKLGVPIVTRHNEVAPCQFEMAPMFEETDIASDHNQLVMSVLKDVALRHGLQVLLHEKPFAGINGSGKHCNWSLSIASDNELNGINLLKPGKTPHQNIRFLMFLAAVLKGVHKHQGLLRAGIGSSGNEHRLGANEAPPAIISIFMGNALTKMIEDIIAGRAGTKAEQAMLQLGVAKLPEIEQDNTDRNRTSPFAFTGAKFEFRAVGSSQSIAFPVMILNTVVAEAITELTAQLKKEIAAGAAVDDAALKVVRKAFKDTSAIRFEGNGYSEEWVREAKKRGLLNLRRAPEALAQLSTKAAKDLFTGTGVLSAAELESRYHVRVERYVKDLLIEMEMMSEMLDTMILPAAYAYLGDLAEGAAKAKTVGIKSIPQKAALDAIGKRVTSLQAKTAALHAAVKKAHALHDDVTKCAAFLTSTGADAMAACRDISDALEVSIGDQYWPLPRYREMLFPV
ncbi:MAG: glutamine synthetase III [Gemmatimonadaceae bacterium]|nr:glutamine synthetase III [Gemmatimonadaceae bacterium]MCW5827069.1 glutamine synthetase III [Gemmatimonadaceae bacterium]